MKVSVIMASYLGAYPGSASNREQKFIRAVNSFKKQTYADKELIIVADGCPKTVELYHQHFINDDSIKLTAVNKQAHYSGEMRNAALRIASGEVISYLDSDDVIGTRHLEIIMSQFDLHNYDWVYYNDYMVTEPTFKKLHLRIVEPRFASIGTSAITHKKDDRLEWMSGYGHDFLYVIKLASLGLRYKKLETSPQYLVCHYYNGDF